MPPRVVKDPAVRRGELLDTAQALFFEHGYERTTINEVIAKAGVSKGGFYHHFSSKEELLEALSIRLAQESVARFTDVLEAPNLDALARLNWFFARARQIKVENAPQLRATFDALFKPENLLLYHRINAVVLAETVPVLAQIVEQGKAEGTFNVPNAKAAAEIVLWLSANTREVMSQAIAATGTDKAEATWNACEEWLRFQGIAIDRILGLPDGSVVFVEPGYLRTIMAGRRPQ